MTLKPRSVPGEAGVYSGEAECLYPGCWGEGRQPPTDEPLELLFFFFFFNFVPCFSVFAVGMARD